MKYVFAVREGTHFYKHCKENGFPHDIDEEPKKLKEQDGMLILEIENKTFVAKLLQMQKPLDLIMPKKFEYQVQYGFRNETVVIEAKDFVPKNNDLNEKDIFSDMSKEDLANYAELNNIDIKGTWGKPRLLEEIRAVVEANKEQGE